MTVYLTLYCPHQNDFCTKMGTDESWFNVPLTPSLPQPVKFPDHLQTIVSGPITHLLSML